MPNSPMFIQKLLLMSMGVVLMTLLVTVSAKADERVTRVHTFDLEGVHEVEISNAVGRIDIEQSRGDVLRLVLEIEGKRQGIFRRKVDVDAMDIAIRQRGDTLFLSFDEDDVKADWIIELPAIDRTFIELGVGELRGETGATDLDIEMGVGEIKLEAQQADVGRINLNVGVGDASLRGAEILDRESAFISQSIRAQGKGSHPLEIDLGVGEIAIRLVD